MRRLTLEHHTSFERAERILWHRVIYGGDLSSEQSHERRPHFYVAGWPKPYNSYPVAEEIILQFEASFRPKTARTNVPVPGYVNIHRDAHGSAFWQATVYEDQLLTFVGATDLAGGTEGLGDAGRFLRRLIAVRLGTAILTGCRQEGRSKLPKPPSEWARMKLLLDRRSVAS